MFMMKTRVQECWFLVSDDHLLVVGGGTFGPDPDQADVHLMTIDPTVVDLLSMHKSKPQSCSERTSRLGTGVYGTVGSTLSK